MEDSEAKKVIADGVDVNVRENGGSTDVDSHLHLVPDGEENLNVSKHTETSLSLEFNINAIIIHIDYLLQEETGKRSKELFSEEEKLQSSREGADCRIKSRSSTDADQDFHLQLPDGEENVSTFACRIVPYYTMSEQALSYYVQAYDNEHSDIH